MTNLCANNFGRLAGLLKPFLRNSQHVHKFRICPLEGLELKCINNLSAKSNHISASVGKQNNKSLLFSTNKDLERSLIPRFTSSSHLVSSKSAFVYERNSYYYFRRFYRSSPTISHSKGEAPSKPVPPLRPEDDPKPSLWKRFKNMYKEYWYVLVPVHVATSAVWFGGFYYLARSGVDIIPLLERIGASEKIVNSLKDSKAGAEAGYVAIAYAMYKIATPARYAVTLGGTTLSIGYLKRWGIIKPAPSTAQIRSIIKIKRSEIQEQIKERRAAKIKRKQLRKRARNNNK